LPEVIFSRTRLRYFEDVDQPAACSPTQLVLLRVALLRRSLVSGAGGEAAITPYLLTRYFGLRAFSTLYGLTWTFYAAAGAMAFRWSA
jgi:hypothetical protein